MRNPARLLRLATACALLLAAPVVAAPVRTLFALDVVHDERPGELDVAASTSGDLLVAWRTLREDDGSAPVRARLYDSTGRPKSAVLTLGGRGGAGAQVVPALYGSFWVVFATVKNAIVARRVTRHGTVEGASIPLLPPARELFALRAEGNPSYDGFVVWTHTFDETGNHSTLRSFDRAGSPLGPPWREIGGDPRNELAVTPDGHALLIAESIDSDGLGSHLYGLVGQLFDRTGAPVGAALTLTPQRVEGYWGGSFDVTSSAAASFLVTWLVWDVGSVSTLLQEVTTAGELRGVREAGARPSGGPTTSTPDGGFVLAWDNRDVPGGPFIAVQRHARDGTPTSDPLLLDNHGHMSFSLASNLTGTDYAAWWWFPGDSAVLRVVAWRFDRQ